MADAASSADGGINADWKKYGSSGRLANTVHHGWLRKDPCNDKWGFRRKR
jgi:hypothetical protein